MSVVQHEYKFTSSSGLPKYWTTATIAKFMPTPDELRPNPHYNSGPNKMKMYLWSRVEEVEATPEFQQHRTKQIERATKALINKESLPARVEALKIKRYAALTAKYPRWTDAAPDACEAMFELNRYAKHKACKNSDEIYWAKDDFIRLLYLTGYATECVEHSTTYPPRDCFGCDGTGMHYNDICYRCDGTGEYGDPMTKWFLCFTFAFGEKVYRFHQKKEDVGFPYTLTSPEATDINFANAEKKVTLDSKQRKAALQLVEWIARKAHDESCLRATAA